MPDRRDVGRKNLETAEEITEYLHLKDRLVSPSSSLGWSMTKDCQEVRDLLSAYFDDELPSASRSQVSEHLASCQPCADELASFDHLSRAARELSHPHPPESIWHDVESQLYGKIDEVWIDPSTKPNSRRVYRSVSIAAMLLVAVTLAFFGYQSWHGPDHDRLAADFSEYLDAFLRDPSRAHLMLVNEYAGSAVELENAQVQLGYLPALAHGLPVGYSVEASYVMDLPCCKCIKTVCTRDDDGTAVAVFEHEDEQPIWFGDHQSVQAECAGKDCTLTDMDPHVAVSWKQGPRHLTVVGVKDVEEATRLIEHLTNSAAHRTTHPGA